MKSKWMPDGGYCPCCGSQGSVWTETGDGDYYSGPQFVCLSCESIGSMWHGYKAAKYGDTKIIEQVRRAAEEAMRGRRG